ncbi:hypothetical protein NP493_336g03012 [Ridgeia piscesae]|uniref:glutaminase n=1 Tax=Ridgeia piscesae TaxID=27915 RepID=A0AAD9L525_RIDPI|nr:hypothetical protein NP493_336g03012 [Ridgeia piscesae]
MSGGVIVRVGILAVQGDFAEHEESFRAAARAENSEVAVVRVRLPADLTGLHGLVLPGGESTVMARFMRSHGLAQSVRDWMRASVDHRRQIWGTCAGLILLADKVIDKRLGTGHVPDTEPGQGSRHGIETGQTNDTYRDVDAPQLLGCLSISVVRNSYGGQRDSFESDVFISSNGNALHGDNKQTKVVVTSCRGIFIRAPGIKSFN